MIQYLFKLRHLGLFFEDDYGIAVFNREAVCFDIIAVRFEAEFFLVRSEVDGLIFFAVVTQ